MNEWMHTPSTNQYFEYIFVSTLNSTSSIRRSSLEENYVGLFQGRLTIRWYIEFRSHSHSELWCQWRSKFALQRSIRFSFVITLDFLEKSVTLERFLFQYLERAFAYLTFNWCTGELIGDENGGCHEIL